MSITKFLAFDIGAESGRASVGIFKNGKIYLEEIHRFPNNQLKLKNGLCWDIYDLFGEIKKGLSIAVKKGHKDIQSMGLDTWGVDFGLIGKDGEILELPHTYRDNRTEGIPEKVFEKIPLDEIYRLTGVQFMNINSVYQLYSAVLNDEPLIKKCSKILFMPDLFNYMLTGIKKSEYTISTTSQMLNISKKKFDEKIFSSLGIPIEITCPIIFPGTVIGKILPEISKETGVGELDVIAVGSHDTASAVAAIPAQGNDWTYLSSGTWSLLGIETDIPIIDSRLCNEFTNEGGVNGKILFLRNITGLWLFRELKRSMMKRGKVLNYNELTHLAMTSEKSNCYIDPDDNAFANPNDMFSAIDNYCVITSQRKPGSAGEYARSVLESLAYKYKTVLEKIESVSNRKINKIHIVGGGSKNEFLNQLTATSTDRQVISGPAEATSLGNILVQAITKEKIKSLEEARHLVAVSFPLKTFLPESS